MTTDEFRRRREETQVEIRKAKREDSLNKRRNIVENAPAASALANTPMASDENVKTSVPRAKDLTAAELAQRMPNLVQGLYSADMAMQYSSAFDFRKIVSKERNAPIQEVVDCGVVPRFVDMLAGRTGTAVDEESKKTLEKLMLEAAWVLTNIASGDSKNTMAVVQAGAVPILISLLVHENGEIREQCIWALGNVAGDGPKMRDYVLEENIMSPVLENIVFALNNGASPISTVRNGAWTIANLCRGSPPPPPNQVVVALPVLLRLLHVADEDTLVDACWALAYMSTESGAIEEIIVSGIVPYLVPLLTHKNSSIQIPALRALGNIVSGTDTQTQAVIDAGALPALRTLLSHPKTCIVKEACWTISNITAGTAEQIEAVINANIIPSLVHLLSFADYRIKKEACWACCNATSTYNTHPHQVKHLVNQGCIKPLCSILEGITDSRIILVALDGLANILSVGEQEALLSPENINPYAQFIEEVNGLNTICNLQDHSDTDIYVKAKGIIDKYYGGEDDDEGDLLEAASSFEFNPQAAMPQGGFKFP